VSTTYKHDDAAFPRSSAALWLACGYVQLQRNGLESRWKGHGFSRAENSDMTKALASAKPWLQPFLIAFGFAGLKARRFHHPGEHFRSPLLPTFQTPLNL
jgi:hypothetical protein